MKFKKLRSAFRTEHKHKAYLRIQQRERDDHDMLDEELRLLQLESMERSIHETQGQDTM